MAPSGCSCETFQGTAVRAAIKGTLSTCRQETQDRTVAGSMHALLPAEIAKAAEHNGAQKIRVGPTTLLTRAVLEPLSSSGPCSRRLCWPAPMTTAASTGPRACGDATFQRLWAELDRNEDILDERLVRVAARLMKKWAR